MNDNDPEDRDRMPAAVPDSVGGGISAAWLVPFVVGIVVCIVLWRGWSANGVEVAVDFESAHGLQVDDLVRCRGVAVGRVVNIVLSLDSKSEVEAKPGIRVALLIRPEFADAIREGTRFWIERPQFDLRGVDGLETIAGGRFVGVLPGTGALSVGPFMGDAIAPGAVPRSAGDLVVVVESSQRAGLRLGGPVTYRGVRIGEIERVGLGDAGNTVEARLLIDRRYRNLVRERSRFFSTSGVGLELGLGGLRADIGSLEELVVGGVGLATPPDGGSAATSGDRYPLAERADGDWLEWKPSIAWTHDSAPSIEMSPMVVRYQEGLLRRPASNRAWVVHLGEGVFVVPQDVLRVPNDAKDVQVFLGGTATTLPQVRHRAIEGRDGVWRRFHVLDAIGGVDVAELEHWSDSEGTYPTDRVEDGELLLIVSGRSVGNVPVPGHQWRRAASGLELLDVSGLYDADHGVPVVSAESGAMVGLLDRRGSGWGIVELETP